jgi:CRISPR-associated protein Cmr2
MTEFTHGITNKLADISAKDQEYRFENNRKPKNKVAIQRLENELDLIYSEIIHEFGPSIGYLYLKSHGISTSDRLRAVWQKNMRENSPFKKDVDVFNNVGLSEYPISLNGFPKYSLTIHIEFKLAKPYISRNDEDFYIVDNPILKDKAFQIPMVRPSGWKGALSGALHQLGHTSNQDFVKRVFGKANESDDDGNQDSGSVGRMHIFPSFFLDAKTRVEVINPRERTTQAGTMPIPFDVVGQGSHAVFSLLYVPLDRIAKNEEETRSQVQEDIGILLEGIKAMFTTYGFGAKTSSGFGVAEDSGEFEIRIKGVNQSICAASFSEMASKSMIEKIKDAIQRAG